MYIIFTSYVYVVFIQKKMFLLVQVNFACNAYLTSFVNSKLPP